MFLEAANLLITCQLTGNNKGGLYIELFNEFHQVISMIMINYITIIEVGSDKVFKTKLTTCLETYFSRVNTLCGFKNGFSYVFRKIKPTIKIDTPDDFVRSSRETGIPLRNRSRVNRFFLDRKNDLDGLFSYIKD